MGSKSSDNSKKVAIVVLNHNGKDLLLKCLRCLMMTNYGIIKIVVVDNGSSDGSVEAVERFFPSVKVISNSHNAGVAGGRNIGLNWIRANIAPTYIIFLDNDTQVEPAAVGSLIEVADRDPSIGLVAPKAFHQRGDRQLLSAGGMHFNPYTGCLRDVATGECDRGQYEKIREIQACPGFAFLVRTTVFDKIKGFDDNFNPYGWEDVDLSLRASQAGYRILYAPNSVVYHAGGRSGRGISSFYERHKAKNMFYFVKQHTTSWQWLCFLYLLPLRALVRIMKEILTGNANLVLTWLAALYRKE